MFDLTKEIQLSPKMQKQYAAYRAILVVFFVGTGLFILYQILFPTIPLDFSMNNPSSAKNTLISPRTEKTNAFPAKGIVAAGDKFVFNANPMGQFDDAKISFTLSKNSKSIENALIEIQKSYQAFFYPAGKPIGFRDGALLTTPDGEYFIVSNGALRKFANTNIILQLGYPKASFMTVSKDDLKFNEAGQEISDSNSYPDNSIFIIDDTYYELKNAQLFPFISTRAFLSQFDPASAITKNNDFLAEHQVSETNLGFIDGALGSSDQSVFILSEGKKYPIENSQAFEDMGFDWTAVVQLTQDELGAYIQQKQFTHDQPHPNGTIFTDKKTGAHFIIQNGFKRPIFSDAIFKTFANSKEIVADSDSMTIKATCLMKKSFFNSKSFECDASLKNLESLVGNDFQITATFPTEANLTALNTKFSTPLSTSSMRSSLSKIKERTLNR